MDSIGTGGVLTRTHRVILELMQTRLNELFEKMRRVASRVCIVMRQNTEMYQRHGLQVDIPIHFVEDLLDDYELKDLEEAYIPCTKLYFEIQHFKSLYISAFNSGSLNHSFRQKITELHVYCCKKLEQIKSLIRVYRSMTYILSHIDHPNIIKLAKVRSMLRNGFETDFYHYSMWLESMTGMKIKAEQPTVDSDLTNFPDWWELTHVFGQVFGVF